MKRALLIIACSGLVLIQGSFLYMLGHGAMQQFIGLWKGFGVTVPPYTQFVFHTLPYWWALPLLSTATIAFAVAKRQSSAWLLSGAVCVGSTVALLWSTYAPSLIIKI